MSDSEIEKMVKDAELHKEEDARKKEVIEARNHADSLAHQTQKSLDEHKANLNENDANEIQNAINALKECVKNDNATKAELEDKTKALAQAAQKLGEAMANKNNAEQPKKKDDDVIDAEVE
ncbi:hypothetical protein HpBGD53_12280 [Helicobacter pylori]